MGSERLIRTGGSLQMKGFREGRGGLQLSGHKVRARLRSSSLMRLHSVVGHSLQCWSLTSPHRYLCFLNGCCLPKLPSSSMENRPPDRRRR
ncbi:hypothetical protein COP1_009041 [Malus domestica]